MSPAEIALRMVSTARACHAASTRARIAQRGTLGGAGQPTPAAASMTRVVENICTRGRPSHGDCVGMQSKSEAASCATSTSTPDAPRAKAAAAASRKAELASAGVAAESSDNSCRNSRARRLRRPRSTCPAADTNAAKGSSAAQAPCASSARTSLMRHASPAATCAATALRQSLRAETARRPRALRPPAAAR